MNRSPFFAIVGTRFGIAFGSVLPAAAAPPLIAMKRTRSSLVKPVPTKSAFSNFDSAAASSLPSQPPRMVPWLSASR